MDRIKRCAAAPHLGKENGERWQQQLELFSQQAQALQQQSHTQQALLAVLKQQQEQRQQQQQPHAALVNDAKEDKTEAEFHVQPPNQAPVAQPLAPDVPEIVPELQAMSTAGGEGLLRAVFSVADTLSLDEIKALALQTGRSRSHVRGFFTKLRSSVQVGWAPVGGCVLTYADVVSSHVETRVADIGRRCCLGDKLIVAG
jgi:hypothetical protein